MRVFEQYNDAVWPWHVLIYSLGLIAFALAFTPATHLWTKEKKGFSKRSSGRLPPPNAA